MSDKQSFQDLVRSDAERALSDERWPWLRSQSGRRRLCVATLITLVVYTVALLTDSPVIGLVALLAYIAAWTALRVAVRKIVDLPDQYIDERMRMVRGEVYRLAYMGLAGLVSALVIMHILLTLLSRGLPVAPLTGEQWFDMMFVLIFMSAVLPNLIYAWRERDI